VYNFDDRRDTWKSWAEGLRGNKMRKNHKYFIAILFLCICGNVFPQSSLSHLSLENRYNTLSIEYQIRGTGEYPRYFFYGFDDYSEAIMWDNDGEYPHWVPKHFWTLLIKSKKDSQFITFGGGYPETAAFSWLDDYEYHFSNNRLVDFNIVDNYQGKKYISRESYNIENEKNRLIVSTRDTSDGTMPPRYYIFYNTPREELLRIYIKNFLNSIDYIINKEWLERNKNTGSSSDRNIIENSYNMPDINRLLKILTKHELSIFRNYMYARHNYAFKTNTWIKFFSNYYKPNYNGTKTNDEVMAIMSEYEKSILNLVIEIENQK